MNNRYIKSGLSPIYAFLLTIFLTAPPLSAQEGSKYFKQFLVAPEISDLQCKEVEAELPGDLQKPSLRGYLDISKNNGRNQIWSSLLSLFENEIQAIVEFYPPLIDLLPVNSIIIDKACAVNATASLYDLRLFKGAISNVAIIRHELAHLIADVTYQKYHGELSVQFTKKLRQLKTIPWNPNPDSNDHISEGFFLKETMPDAYAFSFDPNPYLGRRIEEPRKLEASLLKNGYEYEMHSASSPINSFIYYVGVRFGRKSILKDWLYFIATSIPDPTLYEVKIWCSTISGLCGPSEFRPSLDRILTRFSKANFSLEEQENFKQLRLKFGFDKLNLERVSKIMECGSEPEINCPYFLPLN